VSEYAKETMIEAVFSTVLSSSSEILVVSWFVDGLFIGNADVQLKTANNDNFNRLLVFMIATPFITLNIAFIPDYSPLSHYIFYLSSISDLQVWSGSFRIFIY